MWPDDAQDDLMALRELFLMKYATLPTPIRGSGREGVQFRDPWKKERDKPLDYGFGTGKGAI